METESLVSQNVIPLRSQFATLNEKNGEDKNKSLRSQFVILNKKSMRGLHVKFLPYVFTEQGVAMLSSVLKSERAIEMNIIIMRAFVKIRNLIYSYKDLAEEMEKTKKQIGRIFKILDGLTKNKNDDKEKLEIGFKG